MEDEWTKVISGNRLVKFTYLDFPGGVAFLTAQIAGHHVVYSVVFGVRVCLATASDNPHVGFSPISCSATIGCPSLLFMSRLRHCGFDTL